MKIVPDTRRALPLLLLPLIAGCLTSRVPEVSCWNLEYSGEKRAPDAGARFGMARVSQILVRAPYASTSLVVLRANGTVAFDPYNEFAAGVVPLLKGVVFDAVEASGRFKAVVEATSSASAASLVEVTVSRLALDCRTEGSRRAVAELLMRVVDGRAIVASANGSGEADAADGNYGAAFSRAVSQALSEAASRL